MATMNEILDDGETGDMPRDERGRFVAATPAEPEAEATPAPEPTPEPAPVAAAPAPTPAPEPPKAPTPAPKVEQEPREVAAFKAAAMEERRKRQALEQELAKLREQQNKPALPDDPYAAEIEQRISPRLQEMEQRMLDRVYNALEAAARARYPDYDEKRAVFLEMVEQDPTLAAGLQTASDPAEYAYKTAKRLSLLRDIGEDPDAYRARIEAEMREKLMAEFASKRTPPPPTPPPSLNGEKSPAASAQTWSGPAPLTSLFQR